MQAFVPLLEQEQLMSASKHSTATKSKI